MSLCPLRLEVSALPGSLAPLDLALVKSHLSIDAGVTDFDTQLDLYMKAAVSWAEGAMHRSIYSRQHKWVLAEFPTDNWQKIWLPRGHTVSVGKIEYATGGALTALTGPTSVPPGTDYTEDLRGDSGGTVMPNQSNSWPSADRDVPAPVTVTFTAGWITAEIPQDIVHALLFAIEDMFDVRGTPDAPSVVASGGGARLNLRSDLVSPWTLNRWY